jgi:uncharacterized protein DUF5335
MTVRQLGRDDWHAFLEHLTRTVQGRQTQVEVASADLGDQRLAENVPLLGLSYDTRGDIVEIEFETIDHRIVGPSALFVDQPPSGMIGLEIVDKDGTRTILRLKEPLLLPAPAGAGVREG